VFKQMLYVNWKGSRLVLFPLVIASFGLPLLAVQGILPTPEVASRFGYTATSLLNRLQIWLPVFPALAAATGGILALAVWNWDHRVEHVYPLSLPLPRWQYSLLKMGSGAILLMVPAFTFWMGSLLATASIPIPEGLNAYPTSLAIRFLFASAIAYTVMFTMAAGTMRTAIIVITAFVTFLVAGSMMSDFIVETVRPDLRGWSFLRWFSLLLIKWPGPFEVFTGSWMLIDV
jgi:hypothetical protein